VKGLSLNQKRTMNPEDIKQEMKKKKKKKKTLTRSAITVTPVRHVELITVTQWIRRSVRCGAVVRCVVAGSMIAVHRAMECWTLVTCLLVWTVLINQCLHTLPHNE